tara:strand:- start:152 stop:553 length:402 start_codon:yes stop_codon:yes gene_type:complete
MNKLLFLFCFLLLIINSFALNSLSIEPDEVLKNPIHEKRARNISKNIRCLVCQNQSIDDSSAILARDLRIIIRKMIFEGYKDDEIYKFLTDRYGDFILLKPPLKASTLFLWFGPIIFLLIGILIVLKYNKKKI